MKVLLVLIIIIHGLIHFLGFVKGYHLAEVEQLTQPISRPIGLVWLLAGLLFLGIGILLFLKKDWIWMPTAIAVIISQGIIFLSWHDAKFGTVANIILAVFAVFSFASWNFNNQIA